MSTDLSFSIAPKSDQLNADDLIAGPITVTVLSVNAGNSPDQPVSIEIGDGRQPYKPCKSMRRLLIAAWGKFDTDWIGKKMTLFCDETVKWAGKAQGGIRISHISGISKRYDINLTATRGIRKKYTVNPIVEPDYPFDRFEQNLPQWTKAIGSGKHTPEGIIAGAGKNGKLTQDMINRIYAAAQQSVPEPEPDLIEQSSVIDNQPRRGFNPANHAESEQQSDPQQQPDRQPEQTDNTDPTTNF